ncbi:TPA: phage tail tape measure protein [Streptococcus suis]|nr:phage tail tape measure protein [Streptococcus suis]
MASNIKGITFEIGGNTKPLQKALGEVTKEATSTTKEIREIDRALKFDPKNVVLLTQKQELLGKQVGITKEKLEVLKKAQEQVDEQFEKGDIGEDQYRAFQREIEKTKGLLSNYESKIKDVDDALAGNANQMTSNAASMEELQSSTNSMLQTDLMMEFADKAGQAGEKLIQFGEDALEAFRTVDSAMDTVTTKTGASGKVLEEMQGIVSDLAISIPTDFDTAGEAVGEMNTQFSLTGDELKKASEMVIKFAEINGADVTNSTISAKQAIEAYGLEATDLGSVLDSVTATSQNTGVGVEELMDKVITGAPQIKALGLSFEEGAALIGKFEKTGVDSSAALSSLSKASVAYAADGKTLQEGLSGTIDSIKNASSETEALTIASEVFGTKGAARMVDAIQRGSLSFEDLSAVASGASGTVANTFSATLDPIDSFTTAQNAATLAMSELGGSIAETLAPILQTLAEYLQKATDWFTQLPGPVREIVTVLGLVTAVVLTLIPVIVAFALAITSLNMAILPWIIGIVAVIAAVTAIILIIKNWGAIVDWLKDVWDNCREWLAELWDNIVEVASNAWQGLIDWLTNLWSSIVSTASGILQGLSDWLSGLWNGIVSFAQAYFNRLIAVYSGVWSAIVDTAMAVWNGLVSFLTGLWNGIVSFAQSYFNALVAFYSSIWNAIANTAMAVWNGIVSFLTGLWNGIVSTASSIFNSISSTISGIMSGISGTVSGVWNGIKDTISNAINGAKDAVSNAINAIKGFFGFSVSWPKIPMPHFSINPAGWQVGDLLKGKIPTLGVEFYAKGGILTKPTIFGMNGNNAMVGGEAGPEAVLPLNKANLGAIGAGIVEAVGGNLGGNVTLNINVDARGKDAQEIASEIEKMLVRRIVR